MLRHLAPLLVLALAGCGAGHTPAERRPHPPRAAPASEAEPAPEPPPEPEPEPEATLEDGPEVQALGRAFLARMTVWRRADGTRVLSRRCREGPVDCAARLRTFASLIVTTARAHGLDPYLLAALAMRESGLDPAALGRNREAGIVQLHPRGAGRDMRFVLDDEYRASCQQRVDACQGPVLERGASTLARAIEECGSVTAGLGAYASGHCTTRGVHPRRVQEEQRTLRRLAREP